MKKLNYLLILLTIISACHPIPDKQNLNFETSGIIGGIDQLTPSKYSKHVVKLKIHRDDNSNPKLCTGVLIDYGIIATAAHCVYGGTSIDIYFGTSKEKIISKSFESYDPTINFDSKKSISSKNDLKKDMDIFNKFNDVHFKGDKIAMNRDYQINPDFALIYYDSETPKNISPIKINYQVIHFDQKLIQLGYGINTRNIEEFNNPKLSLLNTFSSRIVINSNQEPIMIYAFTKFPFGICGGDSGGPLIVERENELYLIGINISSIGPCMGISLSVIIENYFEFIENFKGKYKK